MFIVVGAVPLVRCGIYISERLLRVQLVRPMLRGLQADDTQAGVACECRANSLSMIRRA